jgi:hypothetical protein
MTIYRGPLSLAKVGTTNTAGRPVAMGYLARQKVSFAVAFPGGSGGSTKCSVRVQVQGPGSASTRWTSIGSAATTIKSTQAGTAFTSTSATPFVRARLLLVTRSTGSGSGGDTVSGWVQGA